MFNPYTHTHALGVRFINVPINMYRLIFFVLFSLLLYRDDDRTYVCTVCKIFIDFNSFIDFRTNKLHVKSVWMREENRIWIIYNQFGVFESFFSLFLNLMNVLTVSLVNFFLARLLIQRAVRDFFRRAWMHFRREMLNTNRQRHRTNINYNKYFKCNANTCCRQCTAVHGEIYSFFARNFRLHISVSMSPILEKAAAARSDFKLFVRLCNLVCSAIQPFLGRTCWQWAHTLCLFNMESS